MEEKLIGFETAKLAKEKGFNLPVAYFYNFKKYKLNCNYKNGKANLELINSMELCRGFDEEYVLDNYNCNLEKDRFPGMIGHLIVIREMIDNEAFYSAPTQSLLQKWLRDKHSIHIVVNPTVEMYWTFGLINIGNEYIKLSGPIIYDKNDYNLYEEALEIGLQEALKLIDNKS